MMNAHPDVRDAKMLESATGALWRGVTKAPANVGRPYQGAPLLLYVSPTRKSRPLGPFYAASSQAATEISSGSTPMTLNAATKPRPDAAVRSSPRQTRASSRAASLSLPTMPHMSYTHTTLHRTDPDTFPTRRRGPTRGPTGRQSDRTHPLMASDGVRARLRRMMPRVGRRVKEAAWSMRGHSG